MAPTHVATALEPIHLFPLFAYLQDGRRRLSAVEAQPIAVMD